MMNLRYVFPASLSSLLLLASCGSVSPDALNALLSASGATQGLATGTAQTLVQSGGNILGNLLSAFTSQVAVSEKELLGTWKYKGSDCVFESENLLAKAGGITAAGVIENKLDAYLSKAGITAGVTEFTFNADKTFTAKLGKRTLSGTYVYQPSTRQLTLQVVGGLFNFTGQVARNGNGVSLLFEGSKLLTILRYTSGLLGDTSAISTASALLGNYQGMHVGLQLTK